MNHAAAKVVARGISWLCPVLSVSACAESMIGWKWGQGRSMGCVLAVQLQSPERLRRARLARLGVSSDGTQNSPRFAFFFFCVVTWTDSCKTEFYIDI